ncbi:hypothetical protein GQ607_005424 [Colletotrichum asianum]|uniref:Uncharacterized protein n=1 Tax=Colletotrichum asianum TaxID=702518 RepID=A0A8H3ZWS2_9PEZI|nr:hypothetical protein GQ607_005424 [Colletotrichum asianum]
MGRSRGAIPYRSGRRRRAREPTTPNNQSAVTTASGQQGGLGQPGQTRIMPKPMQTCSSPSLLCPGVPWPLPPRCDRLSGSCRRPVAWRVQWHVVQKCRCAVTCWHRVLRPQT